MKHVCGLHGFNPMLGDECAACASSTPVDPSTINVYGSNHTIGELRSKPMQDYDYGLDDLYCEWCGENGHEEEECPDGDYETYNIQDFLGKLETFLVEELDEECRGNVFLSETGENSVAINILVGAPFDGSGLDKTCSQINVIIAPTDRSLLGSEGVTIHDNEKRPEEVEEPAVQQPETHGWFDRAMSIFRND